MSHSPLRNKWFLKEEVASFGCPAVTAQDRLSAMPESQHVFRVAFQWEKLCRGSITRASLQGCTMIEPDARSSWGGSST